MSIRYSCMEQDRSSLEWFAQILAARLLSPLPVSMRLIYGDDVATGALGTDQVTILIPRKPRRRDVMEDVLIRLDHDDWLEYRDGNYVLGIDLVGFTLWMLNREEEAQQESDPSCWDRRGRFRLEKTLAYQKGVWQKPVVDILLLKLVEQIERRPGLVLLDRTPWRNRSRAVWLTHDVDKLSGKYGLPLRLLGWTGLAMRELLKGSKSGCLKWMNKCRDWLTVDGDPSLDSIRKLMDRNADVRAMSAFFFMSLRQGISFAEGIRYPIDHERLPAVLLEVEARGNAIGLHPGLRRADDCEYLLFQKSGLERVLRKQIFLVRNHYLHVRFPDAWMIEEQADFRISSNTGWPSRDGFRAGTCWPYQPFDLTNNRPFNIIEVPLIYMDNKTDDAGVMIRDAMLLADEVSAVHGLFTLNFHSTLFDSFEPTNKSDAYSGLLEIFSQQGWHFCELSDIMKKGGH